MPSIIRSGIAVALAVLLGRLLGFGREATIAATFGISGEADVAVFLIGLPDFLINVLGAGGFTAILVIAYRQNPTQAPRLMVQAGLSVLLVVTVLAAILILFRGLVTDLLAPGFATDTRQRAIDLLPAVLLSAPVAAMTGAVIAFLQARDRFFLAASGTAMINATLIAALFLAPAGHELATLAAAVLVATGLRWLLLVSVTGRAALAGLSLRPWLVDRPLMGAFARAAVSESVVFFYPFAMNAFTTLYGVGALAAVSYATKLVHLPLGAVMMTMSTIMLPRLAQAAPRDGAGNPARFRQLVRTGTVWMAVIGVIAMAILIHDGPTLARLAFGWGAIAPEDLDRIGLYMGVLALMLVPMGLNNMMRRTLNALGDTRKAMRAEITGFAVFLLLATAAVSGQAPLPLLLATAAVGHVAAGLVLARALAAHDVGIGAMLVARPVVGLTMGVGLATLAPLVARDLLVEVPDLWLRTLSVGVAGALGLAAAILISPEGRALVGRLRPGRSDARA